MSKNDWDFFNCSEEYEVNYVASKFTDSKGAKEKINELCKNGTISNSTHGEVYELLTKAGFNKK